MDMVDSMRINDELSNKVTESSGEKREHWWANCYIGFPPPFPLSLCYIPFFFSFPFENLRLLTLFAFGELLLLQYSLLLSISLSLYGCA